MRIEPTDIDGVFVVDMEPVADERGYFARTFDADEFTEAGLDPAVAQTSVSYNHVAGTLRGMHFQQAPFGESKLVRCTRGRIFDVAVDARSGSSTFGHWQAWELSDSNRRAVFLPHGVAHGFLTLADASEVLYQVSAPYRAESSIGFGWNDPIVSIEWPAAPQVLSNRDRGLPPLSSANYQETPT